MSQGIAAKADNPTTEGGLNQTPDSVVTQKLPIKPLRKIIFKQLDIHGTDPGHYWVELYSEDAKYDITTLEASYGWFPFVDKDKDGKNDCVGEKDKDGMCKEDARPDPIEGLKGTQGRLNRGHPFDPHATDKKIDWEVDKAFYPISTIGQSEEDAKKCIKQFANDYKGNWAWPSLNIKNRNHCRTFQEQMMEHCHLVPSEEKIKK